MTKHVLYFLYGGEMVKLTYDRDTLKVLEVRVFEPGPPSAGQVIPWSLLPEDYKHRVNVEIVNYERSTKLHPENHSS